MLLDRGLGYPSDLPLGTRAVQTTAASSSMAACGIVLQRTSCGVFWGRYLPGERPPRLPTVSRSFVAADTCLLSSGRLPAHLAVDAVYHLKLSLLVACTLGGRSTEPPSPWKSKPGPILPPELRVWMPGCSK
jgi:hypothetical protein